MARMAIALQFLQLQLRSWSHMQRFLRPCQLEFGAGLGTGTGIWALDLGFGSESGVLGPQGAAIPLPFAFGDPEDSVKLSSHVGFG